MLKSIFLSIVLLTVVSVKAQITQGRVEYSVSFSGGAVETNEMVQAMMADAKMTTAFSGKNSKVVLSFGSFMTTTTIVNKKKSLLLFNALGTNSAVKFTLAEMMKETKQKVSVTETGKTKDILGYSCKEAIITNEAGESNTVWYTTAIKINTDGQQFYSNLGKGFILEATSVANGTEVKFVAAKVTEEKVDASEFSVTIPEGYKQITKEEYKKIIGGQ